MTVEKYGEISFEKSTELVLRDNRTGQPRDRSIRDSRLAARFEAMIGALRNVQNAIAGSKPTADVAMSATDHLRDAYQVLALSQVDESDRIFGYQVNLPGRGQGLVPPVYYEHVDATRITGRVVFGRFYVGSNGAVHGGVIPLLFDEILGRLTAEGHERSRTAYLHVNFRKITPIDTEIRFDCQVKKVDGRKIHVEGTLFVGDDLVADADALFVVLKPGQP